MVRIGITGQNGFIGTHLYNTLGLGPDKFQRVPFERVFFEDSSRLEKFVSRCDVIVHLAALNRHNDPRIIFETNINLIKRLIRAMEITESRPHVLFASSIQEERDNPYGRSKKEGRRLLEEWATKNKARFTGLVMPNVFGPFGHPYHNSVVATFCHQLTHGEQPKIEVDGELKLIYVAELVKVMIEHISDNQSPVTSHQIPHRKTIKVSALLDTLYSYKTMYLDQGVIPDLYHSFERDLFNTFVCYIDHQSFFPFPLKLHTDERGSFVETIKLCSGGQVSFSTTKPGITRGNHFHTRKAERFAVIKGKARIDLRRIGTDKVLSFDLDGAQPSFVDMPVWYSHNITNTGDEDVYTIFWISEHYDPDDTDTYFEKV